jgi:phosphoglycerate dehydrogenase-like enzyme
MNLKLRIAMLITLLAIGATVHADDDFEQLVRETGIEKGPFTLRERPAWQPPKKILIYWDEMLVDDLRQRFPALKFDFARNRAEGIRLAANADAIIGTCDAAILDAAPRAAWIQITGAGAERCVNLERIESGEVTLTNAQKMSSPALGEHAAAMVMSLARGLVSFSKSMPSGEWRRQGPQTDRMQSVAGKTLLVVGLGGIGTEAARRGAALGMRVVATRRSERQAPDFVDYVGLADELLTLAAEADFIINALPLTPETRGIFDADFFDAVKRGAYFVSVGRGASTVTADLVAALASGQLGGVGLDVTDPEPLPPEHPLWQMDNVIITPHIGGRGGDRQRRRVLYAENVRRFIRGDALYNVVLPERGY